MTKKLRLFILMSVILNFILIGVIMGHSYNRYGMRRVDMVIDFLDKSSIPEAQRIALKGKFKHIYYNDKVQKQKQQWRKEIRAVMTAEEFDAEAYRIKLEEMTTRRNEKKQKMSAVMIEMASQLNLEERKALADMFRNARKKRSSRKSK